jgi:hypothetical protein
MGDLAVASGYRFWPEPSRTMAVAIDAAVSAAQAGDAAAFAEAATDLRRVDREALAIVLGTVMQDLLEHSHPDGLGPEDAEQILQGCAKAAAGWYEQLDGDSLVRALIGTFGISDPGDEAPPDAAVVVAHGLLLIADQLKVLDLALPPVLHLALHELQRAQTIELP